MRSPNETITSRIPRHELVGLLDTMTPFEQQRVTSEFKAVTVADIEADLGPAEIVSFPPLQDAAQEVQSDVSASPSSQLVVRFNSHVDLPVVTNPALPSPPDVTERRLPSWAIVASSCVLTLLLGCLTMAAA